MCQNPVPPFGMRHTGRSRGAREADGPSSEGLLSATISPLRHSPTAAETLSFEALCLSAFETRRL